MIENRLVWLENVLKVEGGYVNDPNDKGGPTNFGITLATLRDWRGEDCSIEDVVQLTESEASDIYMSRYWSVMRGDQLPGGVDIYACDTAVNSGPGRAAKLLQAIVDTKVDSFIGPKTIEAIRKQDPLQLLLNYHASRMEFLMDLASWDRFGRGWTNRCSKMLTLARSKIRTRPGLDEAKGSAIIKTAVVGVGGTVAASGGIVTQYGPQLAKWLQDFLADPTSIEKLETGVRYVNGMPLAVPLLSTAVAVMGAGYAVIGWWRWRMFTKGNT
jgi:lysozyme family protein